MINRTLASLAVLALVGPTAVAQQAIIDRCKETSSDADRIACLEAALLGREPATTEEPRAPVGPATMEPDAGLAVDDTPTITPAAAAAPIEEVPVGIGAEQVIARNQSAEGGQREFEQIRNLRVASYDTVPFERLVVRLENGQVWRQIKGDQQRIRVSLKRNQTVDISEASMSGYKLRLNEIRRTIRVERIK